MESGLIYDHLIADGLSKAEVEEWYGHLMLSRLLYGTATGFANEDTWISGYTSIFPIKTIFEIPEIDGIPITKHGYKSPFDEPA